MNALAQIQPGIFAHLLPPRKATLRDLWLNASDADEAVSAGYREGLGEYVMDALENAASDARAALVEHLFNEHGLTSADIRRGFCDGDHPQPDQPCRPLLRLRHPAAVPHRIGRPAFS